MSVEYKPVPVVQASTGAVLQVLTWLMLQVWLNELTVNNKKTKREVIFDTPLILVYFPLGREFFIQYNFNLLFVKWILINVVLATVNSLDFVIFKKFKQLPWEF